MSDEQDCSEAGHIWEDCSCGYPNCRRIVCAWCEEIDEADQ